MRTALLGHLADDPRVTAVFAQFPEFTDLANDDRHRRDVEWFYRHELKHPPESLHALAAAYVAQRTLALSEDHRPTVKTGIARAERILSQVPVGGRK